MGTYESLKRRQAESSSMTRNASRLTYNMVSDGVLIEDLSVCICNRTMPLSASIRNIFLTTDLWGTLWFHWCFVKRIKSARELTESQNHRTQYSEIRDKRNFEIDCFPSIFVLQVLRGVKWSVPSSEMPVAWASIAIVTTLLLLIVPSNDIAEVQEIQQPHQKIAKIRRIIEILQRPHDVTGKRVALPRYTHRSQASIANLSQIIAKWLISNSLGQFLEIPLWIFWRAESMCCGDHAGFHNFWFSLFDG